MKHSSEKEALKSVIAIILGLLIAYVVFEQKFLLISIFIIGFIGVTSNIATEYIHRFWNIISKLFNFFIPKIVLSIVYFFFLTPIAFLEYLFTKKDSLQLKNKYPSIFQETHKKIDRTFFEKPW